MLSIYMLLLMLSCCVSGDYDGDEAFVCWDPELIPPICVEPPLYTAAAGGPSQAVTQQDLIEYFASYSNALLGR